MVNPGDEQILSYKDVVLRRSDLSILRGPHFINDRIMEFFLSYISSGNEEVLLVSPAVAFWIMNCPEAGSLKEFVEPLKFPEKELVLFPVNNNDDFGVAEGGSHWSLLVYARKANVFVHHDSCGGINNQYGRQLYEAVVEYMRVDDTGAGAGAGAKFVNLRDSPQQRNSYDCGLYVMAIARAICDWSKNSSNCVDDDDLWFSVVRVLEPAAVSQLRAEIPSLITSLLAQK